MASEPTSQGLGRQRQQRTLNGGVVTSIYTHAQKHLSLKDTKWMALVSRQFKNRKSTRTRSHRQQVLFFIASYKKS